MRTGSEHLVQDPPIRADQVNRWLVVVSPHVIRDFQVDAHRPVRLARLRIAREELERVVPEGHDSANMVGDGDAVDTRAAFGLFFGFPSWRRALADLRGPSIPNASQGPRAFGQAGPAGTGQ